MSNRTIRSDRDRIEQAARQPYDDLLIQLLGIHGDLRKRINELRQDYIGPVQGTRSDEIALEIVRSYERLLNQLILDHPPVESVVEQLRRRNSLPPGNGGR